MSSTSREDLYQLSQLAINLQPPGKQSLWWQPYHSRNFPEVDTRWPIKAAIILDRRDLFKESLFTTISEPSTFEEIGEALWHFNLDTDEFLPT